MNGAVLKEDWEYLMLLHGCLVFKPVNLRLDRRHYGLRKLLIFFTVVRWPLREVKPLLSIMVCLGANGSPHFGSASLLEGMLWPNMARLRRGLHATLDEVCCVLTHVVAAARWSKVAFALFLGIPRISP
uniref:Uncharacterized protein n=1 Tax=Trypanosoma congolense (strain IL3000) TaxID=1068625 RepID=G0UNA4_TRYCI|nr:hypothetical protein, unlikely [Trypanosoma congolense IL3000]